MKTKSRSGCGMASLKCGSLCKCWLNHSVMLVIIFWQYHLKFEGWVPVRFEGKCLLTRGLECGEQLSGPWSESQTPVFSWSGGSAWQWCSGNTCLTATILPADTKPCQFLHHKSHIQTKNELGGNWEHLYFACIVSQEDKWKHGYPKGGKPERNNFKFEMIQSTFLSKISYYLIWVHSIHCNSSNSSKKYGSHYSFKVRSTNLQS